MKPERTAPTTANAVCHPLLAMPMPANATTPDSWRPRLSERLLQANEGGLRDGPTRTSISKVPPLASFTKHSAFGSPDHNPYGLTLASHVLILF